MRVLFASSEIYPLAKTGGLADVSAALPRALSALGVDVHLIMPGYPGALLSAVHKNLEATLTGFGGQDVTRIFSARLPDSGLPVWLVDCPALFNRDGGPYQDADGRDWPDNAGRFAHLNRVAARIATGDIVADWRADVVHANDWHTGLLPLLLKQGDGKQPATLFTIHNLAFQGLFPAEQHASLGLAKELLTADGIEFHGRLSFLKAGLRFSDRLNTVSPSYAREILTSEFGCGLHGLLGERESQLSGILNGIDCEVWDPRTDAHLPAWFDMHSMAGKHRCKAELQHELGLAVEPDTPLLIWVSRITHQKMADTTLEILPQLMERDVQFALIGEGDEASERTLTALAASHRGRMAVRIGYDEPLAHRFYAAGDLLVHPSRFEPCGLTPLYAMRHGTIPVVRRVGGLSDTVVDADEHAVRTGAATGFSFEEPSAPALLACVDRALSAYAQPLIWRRMQEQAMARDFSWEASARRYLALYCELADMPAPVCIEPTEAVEAVETALQVDENEAAAA
jgi:starch synthase